MRVAINYNSSITECPLIQTLMNFNTSERGPLPYCNYPGSQYVNVKPIDDYPDCPGCKDGGQSCPLGLVHPHNGIEFCVGCSECLMEREKTAVLLQKLALVVPGGDSIASASPAMYDGYVIRGESMQAARRA